MLMVRMTPNHTGSKPAAVMIGSRIGEVIKMIAAGEDEPGTLANRGAHSVAKALGSEVVNFPGGHGGFLGGEYGQMGKPNEFAAKLREVLAQ